MASDALGLIDLDRCPLYQKSAAQNAILAQVQADLVRDGCAVLREFLTPDAIRAFKDEAGSVAHLGHRPFNRTKQLYSRVLPIRLERAGMRADQYVD